MVIKNKYLLIMALAVITYLGGCKEFIESSLEDRKVILLAPSDQYQSNRYNINFWWEPVEDAISYRLEVVSPDFTNTGSLVLDTLVKTNKFNFVLEPGVYEWRVRAENGSSKSLYSKNSLIVLASSLTDQQVQLRKPLSNLNTNEKATLYQWEALFSANRYRLQIDTNSFSNENVLVLNETTTNTEYSFSFVKEKNYQWRVRAENDTLNSKWSATHIIVYDATAPGQVSLVAPSSGQMLPKPVAMQWSPVPGASRYQLLVLKSDSTTVFNPTFPMTISTTSHSFNAGTSGEKLYWKVRGIDAAGNVGQYSNLRNFSIQ